MDSRERESFSRGVGLDSGVMSLDGDPAAGRPSPGGWCGKHRIPVDLTTFWKGRFGLW